MDLTIEESKSECDDATTLSRDNCEKNDNETSSWIRSNDELCSLLLSKETSPKRLDIISEYKDLHSIETNDDIYDEFKILAQEMAINPNLDKMYEIDQMIAAGCKSSVSSQSTSPVKDFKHSSHDYLSLQSTEGFYPVVASLDKDVIETDFVTIMEKLLLSLAAEAPQKLANELISSAFLISPNILIFWISNIVKRYKLEDIKRKSNIDDSLLSFCPSEISPVLEILLPLGEEFSNDFERQKLLEKIKGLLSDSTIFLRQTGAIVIFKSLKDIIDKINVLSTEFEKDSMTVKMISPSDFAYIKCKSFSRKGDTLSKTTISLRARGTSLTSLVQSSVCLLIQQSSILAVSTYTTYPIDNYLWSTPLGYLESTMEDIFLLMPSIYDKDILISSGSIELPGGYIIVISPTQKELSNILHDSHDSTVERLIYGDFLKQELSLPSILPENTISSEIVYPALPVTTVTSFLAPSKANLPFIGESKTRNDVINKKNEIYIFWDIESCRLSPEDDVEIILASINIKLLEFIQGDFRSMRTCLIVHDSMYLTVKQFNDIKKYFKVIYYSKGYGVESSIRGEINKLSQLYSECTKPIMCFILGNTSDYTSILATLYLEGFVSVALINGSTTSSDLTLKYQAKWNDIRMHQKFAKSPIRHQNVDNQQGSSSYIKSDILKVSGLSSLPTTDRTNSKLEIVDIPSHNIALHFKKLILWGTQDHGSELDRGSTPKLRGEPFLCSDSDETTIVIINIDKDSNTYALYVLGNGSSRTLRANSLKKMVQMACSAIKVHYFQNNQKEWTSGHVTAVKNSKLMSEKEKELDATVYFRVMDFGIVADIISLTSSQTNRMEEFLDGLTPHRTSMTISKLSTANLSEKCLIDLCFSHAIFVDTKNIQDNQEGIVIQAYGFGMFEDLILNTIQVNNKPSKKLTCDVLSDSYGAGVSDPNKVSPEFKMSKKSKGSKAATGTFVFQDREAGMFYTTFESEIRSFVLKRFNVSIPETNHHISENSKSKASQSSQSSRTPALKIEYTGRNPTDVQQVRNYLEQFNPYYLERKQVYFPMADAGKYKELNQVKSKQDHILRSIRNRQISDKSGVCDPLNSNGFVNIRIKPPMHARGIKRMTLPTDVTVTICSPSGTSDNIHQLLAIENIFLSIDSGYITVSVEMQNTSTIAKELTLRSTRDDFINRYNLIGLRWLDEGSRLSNNIGTAKLWAASWKAMDKALESIKNGGGAVVTDGTRSLKSVDEGSKTSLISLKTDHKALNEERIVVHWPNSSCRYVFLAEPLKNELSDLLNSLRSEKLTITSPYRDKSDHLACMLVEGHVEKVAEAADCIETYLAKVASHIYSVRVEMSDSQKKVLVGNELIKLKEIQGKEGVHFILEPSASDLQSSVSNFDLRLPFNDVSKIEFAVNATHELLSILALCSKTRHMVEVHIIQSSTGVGWEYMCCLLIIDDSTVGLSPIQLSQLSSGHVLVDKDNLTGKMLLRSMIIQGDLEAAISRGLNVAEQLQFEGVTILVPTNLDIQLNNDEVRKLTLETIFNIIWAKSISNIKKINCVESRNETSDASHSDVMVLEPAGGSELALAMLTLLQKIQNRQNINLNYCNVPLPKSMAAELVTRR